MFIVTVGKIGECIGVRKSFTIGLVSTACGSAIDRGGSDRAVLPSDCRCFEGSVRHGGFLRSPPSSPGTTRAATAGAYSVIGGVSAPVLAVGPISSAGPPDAVVSLRFHRRVLVVLANPRRHEACSPTAPVPIASPASTTRRSVVRAGLASWSTASCMPAPGAGCSQELALEPLASPYAVQVAAGGLGCGPS